MATTLQCESDDMLAATMKMLDIVHHVGFTCRQIYVDMTNAFLDGFA
jgi:hypothetical protein